MTGRRGSTASTNGWRGSRLTPMPFDSSNGGQPGFPSRTETRRVRPPTVSILIRSGRPAFRRPRTPPRPDPGRSSSAGPGLDWSTVIDVRSGRVADRHQPAAAEFCGRGLLLTAAFGQPPRVVRPPGPVAGLRAAQPLLGVFRALLSQLVPGLVVVRRI